MSKIDTLEKEAKDHQYELFILYFLLADIDLKGNKKYIDKALEILNKGELKISTIFKLNYYLAFYGFNHSGLEKFLKDKIIEARRNLKPDIDPNKKKYLMDGAYQDIDQRKKSSLIKKIGK